MNAEAIKIHPFYLYVLLRDNRELKVVECGRQIEVGGKLYHQTTDVPPVTQEFA